MGETKVSDFSDQAEPINIACLDRSMNQCLLSHNGHHFNDWHAPPPIKYVIFCQLHTSAQKAFQIGTWQSESCMTYISLHFIGLSNLLFDLIELSHGLELSRM